MMEKPSMYESVPQHDGTDSTVDDQDDTPLFRQDLRRRCCVSYLKYGTILVLYLLAYSVVVVSITLNVAASKRRIGQRFLKTPVDNSYIVYELRVMEQWEDRGGSPITYFAEPSEHIDKHWHDLFQYQNIGLDPELMKAVGREYEGIKLPDGTYYDLVMVFHHLHCIKNLCHALNPEYYGLVNMTVEEKASWNEHTTHCLHMLMEAVMCQGDTTVLTHDVGRSSSPPNRYLTAEGYLVHPEFGPAVVGGDLGNGLIG